jgi:tetratricopeptide (TPR) repeat protein
MNPFSASPARRRSALLAFTLTLATGLLLWNNGRQTGRRETLAPSPVPIKVPAAFQGSESASDYAQKLSALKRRIPEAKTAEEKLHLAEEFGVLGINAHFRNKGEGLLSLEAFEQALALVVPLNAPMAESGIRMSHATTLGMLGRVAEERQELEKALTLATPLADGELRVAEILYRLGSRLGEQGHYEKARRVLDRSLRIRQKKTEIHGQGDCLSALGQLAYEEGQLALARQLLGEAGQLFVRCGDAGAHAVAQGQLGDVALAEGEFGEAEVLYSKGLETWRKVEQGYWAGRFLSRQASLALKQHQTEQAERLAQESLALLEASNSPTSVAGPLLVLGEVYSKRGETERARIALSRARDLFHLRGRVFGLKQVELLERQR